MDSLTKIDADALGAAQAAKRFEEKGLYVKANLALGIAEGLRQAASYIRAELAERANQPA